MTSDPPLEGWMPQGFDGSDAALAHWRRRQADHYQVARTTGTVAPLLPPYIELYAAALRLLERQEYAASVVTAQTACEVLAADVLRRWIRKRDLDVLNDWIIQARRRGSDFADDLVRDLYVALSGDRIQDAPFWPQYKEHVRLRHAIVHAGRLVDAIGARRSYQAAGNFLRHLETVIVRERL